jgi:hypothetical protein
MMRNVARCSAWLQDLERLITAWLQVRVLPGPLNEIKDIA